MPALIWLLLLSLVEGSSWFLPTSQISLAALSGWGGLASGVLWIASQLHGASRRPDNRDAGTSKALPWVAAGALALPATLLSLAQPFVGGTTGATLLAGTPIVSVCALHFFNAQNEDLGRNLMPAIAGLAGALLLLPFHLPLSWSGWFGFSLDLLAVISAGICGAWARNLSRPVPSHISFRQIAVGNSMALLAAALLLKSVQGGASIEGQPLISAGWLLVVGLVFLTQGLTFWSLSQLEPVGFASRFLAIPLVVALESWILWRPDIGGRNLGGGLLMALSIVLAFRQKPLLPSTILPRTLD